MSSSSAATFSVPDHLSSSSDQLCYVHCNYCDTVLAVSVPCTILFKTVTVRCGHCSNLLSVNMRNLLLPAAATNQLHHSFFNPHTLLEEIRSATPPNLLINHHHLQHQGGPNQNHHYHDTTATMATVRVGEKFEELPKPPPVVNRPPEKRQRVPSAYNRFIKDEIQRIKAGNPDISHREAFSAAAKNWAHFPHIHFGLLPDQPSKKANLGQQDGEDTLVRDGVFGQANMRVTPHY